MFAAAAVFILIPGALDVIVRFPSINVFSTISFLIGLTLLTGLLSFRMKAPEVSFLSATRQIVGIPGHHIPLRFSDVERFVLSCRLDRWEISMFLKSGENFVLLNDYPLNMAIRIASKLGTIVAVPVLGDRGVSLKKNLDIDWTLPYKLPSGRFQLEYILLAASLAGTIGVLLIFHLGGLFMLDVAPKWLLLLSMAFPSGQMLTNIQENRGFKTASLVLYFFILFFIVLALWSAYEPASTFLGLIPVAVAGLLILNAWIEGRKMRLWLLLGVVCLIPGLVFVIFSSYQFHSFFRLDPAVVEYVDFKWSNDQGSRTEYPNEIRELLEGLQDVELQKSRLEPRSEPVHLTLYRPAGRDYYIELHREGMGTRTKASYQLSCSFMNVKIHLGTVSSNSLDNVLMSIDSTYGRWPPRY